MSLFDLSDVVDSMATGTYTVTRRAAEFAGGDAVPTSSETLTIKALVVPLSGRELQRLPEGLRSRELKAVYTTTDLRRGADDALPDVVTVDGEDYEVQLVDDWQAPGGFLRAVVARIPKIATLPAAVASLGLVARAAGEIVT